MSEGREMYDGRKVIKETEYPLLQNYYSDWHQLEIIISDEAYRGIYVYNETAFGTVTSQTFALNVKRLKYGPKKWDKFLKEFCDVWLHEWLHLVGLSEEGITRLKKLKFPVA